jgi:hypothetical protein
MGPNVPPDVVTVPNCDGKPPLEAKFAGVVGRQVEKEVQVVRHLEVEVEVDVAVHDRPVGRIEADRVLVHGREPGVDRDAIHGRPALGPPPSGGGVEVLLDLLLQDRRSLCLEHVDLLPELPDLLPQGFVLLPRGSGDSEGEPHRK